MKRALIGCEFSGVVRRALRARGVDAWSCDLLPAADGSPHHIQGDVLEQLGGDWDIGIFHPPCTYLCSSGLHWIARRPPRVVLHNGKFVVRWANQTDSGQNNLPPTEDRWALRSETYPGIAEAMAAQWVAAVLDVA